jgi:hypothetical protein
VVVTAVIVLVVAVVVTLTTTEVVAGAQAGHRAAILEVVELAMVALCTSLVFQMDLHFMLQTV